MNRRHRRAALATATAAAALALLPTPALAQRCDEGAVPTRWLYDDMNVEAFGVACPLALRGADRILDSGRVHGKSVRFRVGPWQCVRHWRRDSRYGSLAYVRCRLDGGGRMTFELQP